MKSEHENVVLQAIEFWSTVCEDEIALADEAAEALEYGESPERQNMEFARKALSEVLPSLLWLLTKQVRQKACGV
jgi:importin subunit beta-1